MSIFDYMAQSKKSGYYFKYDPDEENGFWQYDDALNEEDIVDVGCMPAIFSKADIVAYCDWMTPHLSANLFKDHRIGDIRFVEVRKFILKYS
jgi:hypothetical protein